MQDEHCSLSRQEVAPAHPTRAEGTMKAVPHYPRPPLSLIVDDLPPFGVKLFVGDADAAMDKGLLRKNDIAIVINCAVNLDIDYTSDAGVSDQTPEGPFRNYKLGLIDDAGNPQTMVMAGISCWMERCAAASRSPRPTPPQTRKRPSALPGGRSRSVILAALYLHIQMSDRFPTSTRPSLIFARRERCIRTNGSRRQNPC